MGMNHTRVIGGGVFARITGLLYGQIASTCEQADQRHRIVSNSPVIMKPNAIA
jgi:hypothetical protein